MASTYYAKTPVSNYALGRNAYLLLVFPEKVATGATQTYAMFAICISAGSVSLDVDTIEIASNCQSGWKIKLPGLISGTLTGTGYIASSAVVFDSGDTESSKYLSPMNILGYLGKVCEISLTIDTPKEDLSSPSADITSFDYPLYVGPSTANPRNGFFKSASISVSPDDAVKMDFTIELSGESDLKGYMAVGEAETGTEAGVLATSKANLQKSNTFRTPAAPHA